MFQAVRLVMGSIYGLVLAAWLAYALLVRCLRGYRARRVGPTVDTDLACCV